MKHKSDQIESFETQPLLNELKTTRVPLEKLTRSELLDAIKTVSATLESQNKKAGWSTWLLLVTVGVLGWASLKEFEQQLIWSQVTAAYLVFSLVFISWEPLSSIFAPETQKFSSEIRFFSLKFLAGFRIELAATALRNGLLFVGGLYLAQSWNIGWVPVLFFGWQFVWVILAILLSSKDFDFPTSHIPRNLLSRSSVISDWVSILFIGLTAAPFLCEIIIPRPDFGSIRLGILLAAILQCLIWLGKSITPPPFLANLRELQQDFSFGRISIEEAHRLADITIAGRYFEDVLRKETLPVISALENLKVQQKDCNEHLEKWNKLVEDSENDAETLPAVWRSCEEQMRILSASEKEFASRYQKLQNKIFIFRMIQPQTKAQLGVLFSSFEKSKNERTGEIKLLRDKFSEAVSLKVKRVNGLNPQ